MPENSQIWKKISVRWNKTFMTSKMTSNLPNSLWWWEHVNLGQKSTDWCKKYQLLQKTQRVFFLLCNSEISNDFYFFTFFLGRTPFQTTFSYFKLLLSVIFQMSCWKISNDWQRPMWRFFLSETFLFHFSVFFLSHLFYISGHFKLPRFLKYFYGDWKSTFSHRQ